MKLLALDIEQFKGLRKFPFAPNGADADIYGDNAVGKTTVADAYFWLLFGKDSAGRSDFDILPMDEHGQIVEGMEASVTGKFADDDGREFTLRRAYHQVFTRKNGEAERKFKGNTTEFFINDVPKPQKDYQAFISGICDEQTFQLLSDPDMFPGKMGWGDRRDMLIRLYAPDIDDREIINAHKELQPLGGYIGFKTVDEYVEITKAQRRKINDQLKEIPGRIDEAEKAKPADLPLSSDGADIVRFGKQKLKLETDLNNLRSGQSAAELQKTVAELRAQIAQASEQYTRQASSGNAGLEASASQLRVRIAEAQKERSYLDSAVSSKGETIKHITAEMGRLRQECFDTAAKTFNPKSSICPTCGQEFPEAKKKQIEKDFNGNKAQKLDELEATGKGRAAEQKKLEAEMEDAKAKLAQDDKDLAELRTQLDRLTKQFISPTPFSGTDEYKGLQEKLAAAADELKVVQTVADKRTAELREQLSGVISELDTVKKRALNKDAVARQDERIADLKKQDKDLSFELAKLDKGIQLAEQFTQQKARDIEDKVNGAFRIVCWKLFDTQINGGVKPCCDVTVNGIPYGKDLNSAARMNAGLDIIEALSEKIGISVPVFIDNSEGVQKLLPIRAQLIQTIVPLAYDKLGKVVLEALAEKYGSEKAARTAYEAPNKKLRAEVRE